METAKRTAGVYAADFVRQDMAVGIGSGTTVYWLIHELERRAREGLRIKAVPTSLQTADLLKEAGITVLDLNAIDHLPLTIDGADEIDPSGNLIKGGGGALLQEKIVASASDQLIIIADNSKLVGQLGRFSLPVEVISFGYNQVQRKIMKSGLCKKATLREKNGAIFISDHSHYILDCEYQKIEDPSALNTALHLIPGVVETGLFIGMANKAIIGFNDERIEVIDYK